MTNYAAALDQIGDYLAAQLPALSIPGLAFVATDRERTLRIGAFGYADLPTRTPVTPATRFGIGSTSKSFAAIAVLRAHEAGLLDLHAPVTRYLPWFAIRSEHAPITIHHLLSHTAGLIAGVDICPDPHFEVWALRESSIETPPGEHFHYSNVGYKILGLILEAVYERPFAAVIREQVLDPLGLSATEPIFTLAQRGRVATGHIPFFVDRPRRRDEPLAPATWVESYAGDGNAVAPPDDIATYMRYILSNGIGAAGQLLTSASFELLTTPLIAMTPARTWHYCYGLIARQADGHTWIGHNGEMLGQYATLLADRDAGLGVMVLINGPGETLPLAEFALGTLRAAHEGRPLPSPPADPDPAVVPNAREYAGTYRGAVGSLDLAVAGDGLVLHQAEQSIRLERRGRDAFLVPHLDFARFLLRFGRAEGRVVEAAHGPHWYAHDRYTGPTTFATPPEWAAYAGHYRSPNPWLFDFRVVVRKGALLLVQAQGREQSLRSLGAGTFRVGPAPLSPERLRFDALLNGATLRANLSGNDYYRVGPA